jgi:hypothetical protein
MIFDRVKLTLENKKPMTADLILSVPPSTTSNSGKPFCFEKYLLNAGAQQIDHPLNSSYEGKSEIKRYRLGAYYFETLISHKMTFGTLVVCDGFGKDANTVYSDSFIPESKEEADALFSAIGIIPSN